MITKVKINGKEAELDVPFSKILGVYLLCYLATFAGIFLLALIIGFML